MSDTTTGPDASGDATTGTPDYQTKYNGLQQAFQKRQNEHAAKEQAWADEREQYEAKLAKLADYEARDAAEREERDAMAQYESLRQRFTPEPPTPESHNEPTSRTRDRDDGSYDYALRDAEKKLGGGSKRSSAWPS